MRNVFLCVFLFVFGVAGLAHAQVESCDGADAFLGTWTGTWATADGNGGELEMTLVKSADGTPGGNIKVSGGEGAHTAEFTRVVFDGNKMTSSYDYPLGDGGRSCRR